MMVCWRKGAIRAGRTKNKNDSIVKDNSEW